MYGERNPTSGKQESLTLENRDEALIATYAVMQKRGDGILDKLPLWRKARLVQSLGKCATVLEKPTEYRGDDAETIAQSLRRFAETDTSQLIRSESAGFRDRAAQLAADLLPDAERAQSVDETARELMVAGHLVTWKYDYEQHAAIFYAPEDIEDTSALPEHVAGVPVIIERMARPDTAGYRGPGIKMPYIRYDWQSDAMAHDLENYTAYAWRTARAEVEAERKDRIYRALRCSV